MSIGLDSVAFLFPVVDNGYHHYGYGGVLGSGARWSLHRGNGSLGFNVGRVEFSAPKMKSGWSSVEPIRSIKEVHALCLEVFDEVAAVVKPAGTSSSLRPCRFDVARNFEVPLWAPHAAALEHELRAPRTRASMSRTGTSRDDLGIGIGNNRWYAAMYDKFLESGLPEARGIVRFEARFMRVLVRDLGLSFDSSPDEFERLCRERFLACGFGARVYTVSHVFAERVSAANLSAVEEVTYLGIQMRNLLHLPERLSKGTQRKYRAIAARVGVGLVDNLERHHWAQLDFESGMLLRG